MICIAVGIGLKKEGYRDLESSSDGSTDQSSYRDSLSEADPRSEGSSIHGEEEKSEEGGNTSPDRMATCCCYCFLPSWVVVGAVLIFTVITLAVRPAKPYNHMSTTLPLPLLDVFKAKPDFCAEQTRLTENEWPLPALVEKANWKMPKGNFKGWAPGANNRLISQYWERIPDWLPDPAPSGFHRWDPSQRHNVSVIDLHFDGTEVDPSQDIEDSEKPRCPDTVVQDDDYSPVDDPLRISNLDHDILQPLRQAMKRRRVKIKHIALIQMESLREELFPLQQGSDIHKIIMESHDKKDQERFNERLSHMTPNSERITGKLGNFAAMNGTTYDPNSQEWDDKTKPGMGGINVVGALTGSSVSMKSVVGSHCGVWPMPVDFLDEAETQSYQPCIPQILGLFNKNRKKSSNQKDFRNQPWNPVFFQAVTDYYDRQNVLNEKMGLTHIYAKYQLENDPSPNPEDDIVPINYFGYPETALKGYMRGYIIDAIKSNERLFFSHFTSTTHHPWEVPKWWNTTRYTGSRNRMLNHEALNKYLNTIRWHDAWLGEMMQMFDDLEISDETLVIFVGDHGQAFKEDTSMTGTYENGHISNFRVPITFRHPHLPRVQYKANATSISILPTILDLLVNSGSLNDLDAAAASDLANDYEGQSLIRPYKVSENGRRAWNFGIVNSGGGMLTVTSADAPWRLVMPLEKDIEYAFTDLEHDPLELRPMRQWTIQKLIRDVSRKYGAEAANWLDEAELVANWWGQERKRLWKYAPSK